MLTIVGKKHSTAAIAIFETGLRSPNQLFVIGANAMIGTAFAAIANGISAMPRFRKRARTRAARIPSPDPMTSPPAASLNVYQPACHSPALFSQNDCAMSDGFGRRKRLDVERGRQPLPQRDREHEHEDRRKPVAQPSSQLATQPRRNRLDDRAHQYTSGAEVLLEPEASPCPSASDSRTAGDELEEPRVLARGDGARVPEVDWDDVGDAARPRPT